MRHRVITLALVGAMAFAVLPARAGAFGGTCTGTVHFDFENPIGNLGGPTTYHLTPAPTLASCQTSADIGHSKTMEFWSNTGEVTSGRCGALAFQGPYVANFFLDPAPSGSNGQANFFGTASGGVWLWRGSNPDFLGVGILVGGGAVSCAQGGTSSLTFTMIFTFGDP